MLKVWWQNTAIDPPADKCLKGLNHHQHCRGTSYCLSKCTLSVDMLCKLSTNLQLPAGAETRHHFLFGRDIIFQKKRQTNTIRNVLISKPLYNLSCPKQMLGKGGAAVALTQISISQENSYWRSPVSCFFHVPPPLALLGWRPWQG